ncbi:hypothetical protein [Rhizobium hidalgonense]|uniref:Mercury transporter n=1 Tax=Rhizobium hidalgonense TaxID=1538159 RepID=A0ABX4JP84_9HYPH|nr:hypothetical protein [Rhizobium hidalgonense]PDT21269.1 hypothetical protein CO674_23720 [Rhizobium hidalgonense]PON07920.1 hypothetical protein ATY29_09260 [Rhizobium hidalgonense]
MNTGMKLTGAAVAACAACCAVSVVPLMLASASAVLVGAALVKWGAVAILLVVLATGLLLLSRRKRVRSAGLENLMAANSCGCGSCSTDVKQEAPIACTLDANAFKARTEFIRTLTSRHLRQATRTGLRLNLTYAPDALAEVRELVRMEQACCAFLTFDVTHDATGVFVNITAPQAAATAADDLFTHFAPASRTLETSA